MPSTPIHCAKTLSARKNEVVATALLPLFEGQPQFWQAITHLNPSRASAGKTFGDYLADWYATCPDK